MNICSKRHGKYLQIFLVLLKTTEVIFTVALDEKSGDQSLLDTSSGDHDCLDKISWLSIQEFLRYFKLDHNLC